MGDCAAASSLCSSLNMCDMCHASSFGRASSRRPPGCRLRLWLDELLWERGPDAPDVLRAKGVLALHGCPQRHVLQAVRPVRMSVVFMTVHAGHLLAAAKNRCTSCTSLLTAC